RQLHLVDLLERGLLELRRKHVKHRYVWPDQQPVGRNGSDGACQLNRRYCDRALADTYRDSLAGVPFLLEVLDLPFFRGHHAAGFVVKINAGLLAETESRGVFRDLADAEPLRQGIEKHITRLIDRLGDLNWPVHAMLK